jgi:threonine dehydrogenase-like Zn-dependent dehydrogenase
LPATPVAALEKLRPEPGRRPCYGGLLAVRRSDGSAMKALTWQGNENVEVTEVADPQLQQPTDAIIRVTSTAICGSDLHLYGVLGPYLKAGDVLGHEAMGIVEEVGSEVTNLRAGDRVVVPFNISCGSCWMCSRGLYAQCETTQVREQGKGAALFGYTSLYGSVPGGQAEYLRVPQAQFGPVKVPHGTPDEQFLFLSDILPTAWQAVRYADVQPGSSVAVLGLGPVGQFAVRIAKHLGAERVIAVDLVAERLALAASYGAELLDFSEVDNVADALIELVEGRGPDAVIDAVGMEAHGHGPVSLAQKATGMLPDAIAQRVTDRFAVDRLDALNAALKGVRRGGTVSVSGVYGGEVEPMPMMEMFDRGVQLRMGQAHVRRWTEEILPLVMDESDPLGTLDLVTHRLPLADAPAGYEMFRDKQDGCIKVVLNP